MAITLRRGQNPINEVRRLNQWLDETLGAWPFGIEPSLSVTSSWLPPTDVFEDDQGIKIVSELPGLRQEDVKLSIENHTLTIRGEKKQEAEEKATKVHRYERSYGVFERSFSLPTTVDSDKVTATFENGVLTVLLPKAEKAKPREIRIGR